MSRRSVVVALGVFVTTGSLGCWEQMDGGQWWPQMKRQIAVQAFEEIVHDDQEQGFSPPEGTVPITGGEIPVSNVIDAEADILVNPTPSDFRSLENGRNQYETFCAPCHGVTGLANGPVAQVFPGVLPLVGIVRVRSDGHIYTTIRQGRRRMPSYARIAAEDRWDIVNYVRYLDEKGGRP